MSVRSANSIVSDLRNIVGDGYIRSDDASLETYGVDALGKGHPPDVVVLPADTQQIAAIARLCNSERVPLVVRGAGTGFTGGAVPTHGGVLISMERLNRILEIDELNLLAVVEPNVINADLQHAVEKVGLFYPPDPASLNQCTIGGNVGTGAGGPRGLKYGVTKDFVLALEIVLANGDVMRTGSRAIKNVTGYNLTQLFVGSEGTLGVVAEITLRLIPKPPAKATVMAIYTNLDDACKTVGNVLGAGIEIGRASCRERV